MRNLFYIISGFLVISTLHYAQLTVKDQESTPNILMQVNDEGSGGSITLPELPTIGTYGSKLYNLNGKLYWSSKQLGYVGSAGGWTDDGTVVRLSTISDKVGIGTTNPQSLLSVGGEGNTNYAIYGEASAGHGIYGKATSYSGHGIHGWAEGEYGSGAYGWAGGEYGAGTSGWAEGEYGRGVYGIATNTADAVNYGGYFNASGEFGRGVYGKATSLANAANYGGYFEANGRYGRGVYGSSPSSDGIGVYGTAPGTSGVGIYGLAENSGSVTNYGGYFEAYGSNGRGIFSHATNIGNVTNYGGYFLASGRSGTGVFGEASYSGDVINYGGYFETEGYRGYGVWAEATSSTGINYGGHFSTASTDGRAIRGHATNTTGENYGGAFRADGDESRAVWAFGQEYDYYAAGPGEDYGSSSSIRWKRNIIEIDKPLDKLFELRGVYFDWDEEHGGEHDVGMIAEEVGKVLPEIVVYEKNGIDAEGMDYSKLTPLLVEVAKAQQRRIEELETRILELMKIVGKEKFSQSD